MDCMRMVSRVSVYRDDIYAWTVWMGGARRSRAGLGMVSRVSVGGAGKSGVGLDFFF